MTGNGFRGSHLPPSQRVASLEVVSTTPAAPGVRPKGKRHLSNEAVLADYLSAFGPQELNLVVMNRAGRSETNTLLADVLDLMDLVTLHTSHGREPSTFNKELLPGLFMAPTPVQEAIGEWGIQGAVDALQEGLQTLGPRPLTPPDGELMSPMMWLVSAGDPKLGEELYTALDRVHRPHRHMWSHAEQEGDVLHWMILAQLTDADIDTALPDLRQQAGYHRYLQRSDRYAQRLTAQTGTRA